MSLEVYIPTSFYFESLWTGLKRGRGLANFYIYEEKQPFYTWKRGLKWYCYTDDVELTSLPGLIISVFEFFFWLANSRTRTSSYNRACGMAYTTTLQIQKYSSSKIFFTKKSSMMFIVYYNHFSVYLNLTSLFVNSWLLLWFFTHP